jgi:nitrogen-specific signal transduction histidine kinase
LQLLPDINADQLIEALLAEREQTGDLPPGTGRPRSADAVAGRELHRLRAHVALGASAHALQHAFNNPLTALLAEAQLLELEPLTEDHRQAVRRILELARRLVMLSRRLSAPDAQRVG